MRGLTEIVMHNTHANGPSQLPDLGKGNVRTVVWSLFDERDDFIRQYVTEVVYDNDNPFDLLAEAVKAEGFSIKDDLVSHCELDFVFSHAVEVIYSASE